MRLLQPSTVLLATTSSSLFLRRQFIHASSSIHMTSVQGSPLSESQYSLHRLIPAQYEPIPSSKLSLKKLVIIHRHGDRAQIAKSLGNYEATPEVTNQYTQLLPSETTKQLLGATAFTADENDPTRILPLSASGEVDIYTGGDASNVPYGQLTELGASQLIELGQRLRQNYAAFSSDILPLDLHKAADKMYCRTTNFCRTHQSLRSLLAGLFFNGDSSLPPEQFRSSQRPIITTRPRKAETLYPQADANCVAMLRRRGEIFSESILERLIPNYQLLKEKMQQILQFPDGKVNWLHIREVSLCHDIHKIEPCIPLRVNNKNPSLFLTEEEMKNSGDVATMTWSVLYNDDILNRMAIGRFLHELLVDMSFSESNPLKDKTALLYSGHDSTLVPVLCALKCYDDKWPEYGSSVIFEIAEAFATGEQFIRVIYNDKVVRPWGSTRDWMPLEEFENRLGALRLSPEDYEKCCKGETLAPLTSASPEEKARLRQIQEDIERETKATTSGN